MGNTSSRRKLFYQILAVLFLFSATTVMAGCEPLRKKFTRKKKADRKEEFIPVLDPIDYPARLATADTVYKYHFSMWQVWSKDLITALEEESSDKRVIYLFDQLLVQLEEMQKVISGEKQVQLKNHISKFQGIRKSYDVPDTMRNSDGIMKNVRRIDKTLRREFKFSMIEDSLIK